MQYKVDSKIVTFQPAASSRELCLHVRLLSASLSWTSQLHCDTVNSGSVKLRDVVDGVKAVEVSFCVRERPDVCGQAQNATIGWCNVTVSLNSLCE